MVGARTQDILQCGEGGGWGGWVVFSFLVQQVDTIVVHFVYPAGEVFSPSTEKQRLKTAINRKRTLFFRGEGGGRFSPCFYGKFYQRIQSMINFDKDYFCTVSIDFFLSQSWYLYYMVNKKRRERKDKFLLFDLFKASEQIESSHKLEFFTKKPILLHACATCSELPSYISTMATRGERLKVIWLSLLK